MNPLILLGAIPSALAIGTLAWLLHMVDVNRIEARQRDALQEQATVLQDKCDADKKLTEGIENDYQKQVNALNSTINALRLRKLARCVPVRDAVPAKRPNAAPTGAKLPERDGVSSEYLIDYAGRAEECRLKLITLQGFVTQVWKQNGLAEAAANAP